MNCSECGATNAPNTRFCTRCGTALSGGAPAGIKRETTADAGVFAPPPASAPAAAARAPSGAVRRTVLEGDAGQPAPMPAPLAPPPPPPGAMRPPAAPGAPMGARSRTVLDEGPAAPSAAPGRPAPGAAVAAGARIVGWMVSYNHNAAGQDYVLRAGKTRVGRGRDNEVSLFYEGKASDLHCTIIWRNGQAAVKDEGSTNGTVVNGEDIGIAAVQQLQHGDTLTVGDSTFQVFLLNATVAAQIWPTSGWGKP